MMYRVYEYGVVRVTAGEDLAIAQLLARWRYWNALVEIEQQHQARREEVLRRHRHNGGSPPGKSERVVYDGTQ